MREIKFRTWDGLRMIRGGIMFNSTTGHVLAINNQPLMQFTGLKDKNGVEIYEGDLVRDSDSEFIGEVIFDEDSLSFTTKFQDNDLWGFVPRKGKDNHCEVISNVYESPELLEGGLNGR